MGIFDGCLLACDVDGTLMTNGVIPPRNIERIRYFTEQGGAFSISTGRSVGALNAVLERVKCISPSVVANGCMIYDFQSRMVMMERTLPPADHRIAAEVLERFPNVGVEVHAGEKVYRLRANHELIEHEQYEHMNVVDADLRTVMGKGWNKALFVADSPEEMERLKRYIASQHTLSSFLNTTATLYGRERRYYEQLPQDVSKATALRELCTLLGIRPGCYFAIGDYYNDLPMLGDADISAAPADSPLDIRTQVQVVTTTASSGAVADFIDRLVTMVKTV